MDPRGKKPGGLQWSVSGQVLVTQPPAGTEAPPVVRSAGGSHLSALDYHPTGGGGLGT